MSVASVEAAMRAVPRHLFVPDATAERAHSDENIVTHRDADGVAVSSASAPGVVSGMLELLDVAPGHRILENRCRHGLQRGVARASGRPGRPVTTVDIDSEVVRGARECLAAAGYRGVSVFCADGEFGYADHAPYDRIVVTAGAWDMPPVWVDQLAPGRPAGRPAADAGPDAFDRSRARTDTGGAGRSRNAASFRCAVRAAGVTVSVTGHLDFWLAGMDGFCRLLAGSQAVDRGLVAPAFGWGSMGVFDQDTFAYLTLSPTGETDGSQWPRYELGVCAYGPDSGELANRVADRTRDWEHDRQSMTEAMD